MELGCAVAFEVGFVRGVQGGVDDGDVVVVGVAEIDERLDLN